MVICEDCKKEMSNSKINSCTYPFILINNELFERNTEDFDFGIRCHDCNIRNKKGNIHHYGCDMERCPRCTKQLLSCDCEVINVLRFKESKTHEDN